MKTSETPPTTYTTDDMPSGTYQLEISAVECEGEQLFVCGKIASGPHAGETFRLKIGE